MGTDAFDPNYKKNSPMSAILIISTVLTLGALAYYVYLGRQCDKQGGFLVRTMWGARCVILPSYE